MDYEGLLITSQRLSRCNICSKNHSISAKIGKGQLTHSVISDYFRPRIIDFACGQWGSFTLMGFKLLFRVFQQAAPGFQRPDAPPKFAISRFDEQKIDKLYARHTNQPEGKSEAI